MPWSGRRASGLRPVPLPGAGPLRAKGRASSAPRDAPRAAGVAFAACRSEEGAPRRALCPRWAGWPFHLRSPDSQTHSGVKHSKVAAGVVVVLLSSIWLIKRAGVKIFWCYLTFPSPQAFVFELQHVQEVSDNLRHLMLGCSVIALMLLVICNNVACLHSILFSHF